MTNFEFGLIVPCFNYGATLPETLRKIVEWRTKKNLNFLLCLVNDGSTDNTGKVLADFQTRNSSWCLAVHSDRNRGKGSAIRKGAAQIPSSVPFLLFTDCDLHYGLEVINERILPSLKSGNSVVILDRSWNQQFHSGSPLRKILSQGFNHLKTILTGVPFEDSQAGLKGFEGNFLRATIPCSRIDGFAFDVELLSIAIKYRFPIDRIAIRMKASAEAPASSVTPRKAMRMFFDLMRIGYARLKRSYAQPYFLERIGKGVYEIQDE
jgi:dolichyl-phosphate beta-glucosyltransferase